LLGLGAYLFPLILGNQSPEVKVSLTSTDKVLHAFIVAMLLTTSLVLEAWGHEVFGSVLHVGAAAVFLFVECGRPQTASKTRRGSLGTGLRWALGAGAAGILLAPWYDGQQTSVMHLFHVGASGLLLLVIGSRLLFTQAGDETGFFTRGGWPRLMVVLVVFAALTRATPAWAPSTTLSHHVYAAILWTSSVVGWLVWHRRRFRQRVD
jgi:hypothetical protein